MMQMQRSSSLPGPGHASPRTSAIHENLVVLLFCYSIILLFSILTPDQIANAPNR